MSNFYEDIDMDLEEKILIEDLLYEDVKPANKISNDKKNKPSKLTDNKKDNSNKEEREQKEKRKEKGRKIFMQIKSLIKSVYQMKDDDFVNGKFFPALSRIIIRGALVAGSFSFGPVVGVITFCANSAIKKCSDNKQRARLIEYYDTKVKWLDDKISNENDPDAKYDLMKMKAACNRASTKLHNMNVK